MACIKGKVPFKLFNAIPLQAIHSLSYIDSSEAAYKICEEILKDKISEALNRILCNLIGFSIELSLKAYILSKDYSEKTQKDIRSLKNGHSLDYLLKEARVKGLVCIGEAEEKSVCDLNKHYNDSGSRYYTEKKERNDLFFSFDLYKIPDYVVIIKKINKETDKIAKSLKNP